MNEATNLSDHELNINININISLTVPRIVGRGNGYSCFLLVSFFQPLGTLKTKQVNARSPSSPMDGPSGGTYSLLLSMTTTS